MITEKINHKQALVHRLFEEYAKTHPHKVAVISTNGKRLTYGDLNKKANQLAHYLLANGWPAETLIAISMPRSADLLTGVLAILKAGYAWLPLDESHPAERHAFILADAKIPALITQSDLQQTFSHFQGKTIFLDTLHNELASWPRDNPVVTFANEPLAYVIYTSGSTGQSKGVLIAHHSLVNYIQWLKLFLGHKPADRIDFSANFAFDLSLTVSIAPLVLGLTIVICPENIKRNIRDYLHYLRKYKINLIKHAPSYFKLMIEEVQQTLISLPSLRVVMLGGENLSSADCKAWLSHFPAHKIINEYGPTETTVGVTQFTITRQTVEHYHGFMPIGKPGLNIQCQLSEDGELKISGECLARGYLHQPELTQQAFVMTAKERWYRTGDICEMLPDGNLIFLGRKDDQVKIRGFKVEPREIETSLLSHDAIKAAVVIARKEKSSGENYLVAYYQIKDNNQKVDSASLRNWLGLHLAQYMIPAHFVRVDKFPVTENGKLDKDSLPEPIIGKKEKFLPQNKEEKKLLHIWQKVFHLGEVGRDDNFFELGGHSLTAARIISNIEKYMNKKLSPEEIYEAPTLGEMAKRIANAPPAKKEKKHRSLSFDKQDSFPLGDFQFVLWISHLFAPQIRNLHMVMARRLDGLLDIARLNHAFAKLLKRHEVLYYRPGFFFPGQYIDDDQASCQIMEHNFQHLSPDEIENKLKVSFQELLYQPEKKGCPLLSARLFRLPKNRCELQIAVSHIIFDEVSRDILLTDLSQLYLGKENLPEVVPFRTFIAEEKNHLNKHIKQHIRFWEHYLRDTFLLKFPTNVITTDKKKESWSTTLLFPQEILESLISRCKELKLGITDALCAGIALGLKQLTGNLNQEKKILFNIVKSARENEAFDHTIGCFLKLDVLRIDMGSTNNFIDLAREIQQSMLKTALHQDCSGMVKVACVEKKGRKRVLYPFMRWFAILYAWLFRKYEISPEVLLMYLRLKYLRQQKRFLINVNVSGNFVEPAAEQNLFGLPVLPNPITLHDFSQVDNILSFFFARDDSGDNRLMLSGNLSESFKQELGKLIIHFCQQGITHPEQQSPKNKRKEEITE